MKTSASWAGLAKTLVLFAGSMAVGGLEIAQAEPARLLAPSGKTFLLEKPLLLADNGDAQLVDLDQSGGCGWDNIRYISPFSAPGLQAVLEGTAKSAEGSIFEFSLSRKSMLGYSPASRLAAVNGVQIDPVDLEVSQLSAPTRAWFGWRRGVMSRLVQDASALLKKKKSDVLLAVNADWPVLRLQDQARSLEDWPAWAQAGWIDGVVLQSEWEKPENKRLLALGREQLQGSKAKLFVVLEMRRHGKALDPLAQLLNLQGEKMEGIFLKVDSEADMPRAQAFFKEVWPEYQFGLE